MSRTLLGIGLTLMVMLVASAPTMAATDGPPIVLGGGPNGQTTQSTQAVETYVEPDGLDTHYQVEYGKTTAYGSVTQPLDMGTQTRVVEETLTGLQVNTTYHFRFVAVNAEGSSYGPDGTFTTSPVAYLGTEAISEAGNTEVTLHSVVGDSGAPSTFYFEIRTHQRIRIEHHGRKLFQ